MRILVVTDTWQPQVNGVVRSFESLAEAAQAFGAELSFLTPEGFPTIGLPLYAEIRLALTTSAKVGRRIAAAAPDHIHIATEGPLGFAARRYCLNQGLCFTTSFHTNFPDYIAARMPMRRDWIYGALRWFHNAGSGILVSTDRLEAKLAERGFRRLSLWSRGVDQARFRIRHESNLDYPRPIHLYVGRLAVEKNLEAFLALDLPGSKVLVGDGPARAALQAAYPEAHFLGARFGEALAETYSSADVFVFPSLTDTFGMVLLEAMASGLPVAAFPVPGPLDLVGDSGAGVLDRDLARACREALAIPRAVPRAHAQTFGWQTSARQFLDHVAAAEQRFALLGGNKARRQRWMAVSCRRNRIRPHAEGRHEPVVGSGLPMDGGDGLPVGLLGKAGR